MPNVRRNGSRESNPEQSGSKAYILPIPAPDTSSQVGQTLVELRRQTTEPQWWLREGKSMTGEGGRGRKVWQSFPGSPGFCLHSQPASASPVSEPGDSCLPACGLLWSQVESYRCASCFGPNAEMTGTLPRASKLLHK